MFADISGFTAWSSVREPAQVFVLLETIYQAFDKIAKQRRVFKVETVGDCYVAVCGLPEPRKDHAVVMALFARDCMKKMKELVRELEVTLGPDTADLANRFGLHSGPCTAGVLRGERARFQLFGDTVNTAARMESTGLRNKIHISQETADLLQEAGKGHWVEERKDIVVAKGKGALQTYWLNPSDAVRAKDQVPEAAPLKEEIKAAKVTSPASPIKPTNQKNQRLIDWNCELLLQNLRKVVARRQTEENRAPVKRTLRLGSIELLEQKMCNPGNALSEVQEIIHLPEAIAGKDAIDPKSIDLGDDVKVQMRNYVSILASLYRDNSFHCFEHASHVTMSVSKLLSRIVAPDVPEDGEGDMDEVIHDFSYGITSDPLTHFAVVLSALIHDVDHRGVPNFVLGKEDPNLAKVYMDKSIAEQNSIGKLPIVAI
jgi:class 3 adenylate cyclase